MSWSGSIKCGRDQTMPERWLHASAAARDHVVGVGIEDRLAVSHRVQRFEILFVPRLECERESGS